MKTIRHAARLDRLGLILPLLIGALTATGPAQPAHAADPFGHWHKPRGDVDVAVAPGGAVLSGTVT